MSPWKLVDIEQVTHERFLNFFVFHYEKEGKRLRYFVASRKNVDELRVKQMEGPFSPDAVVMMLRKEIEGKRKVLLIKEFRPPFGRYFIAMPAGLIEKGEDVFLAARREAKEEVGAKIGNLELLFPASSNSEGMSDELACGIKADIVDLGERNPEWNEDISYSFFDKNEVRSLLDDPSSLFPLPVRLMLELALAKGEID